MYRYFIVFEYILNGVSFKENREWSSVNRVKNISDIKHIERLLAEHYDSPVIINYILMDAE